MSTASQETLSEFFREIRRGLIRKLRKSRLATVTSNPGSGSGHGISDFKIVSGFEDQDFVNRFGSSLHKVVDADIAALTLYLPPQESLVKALGKLAEHIEAAPEGKTGLPYFDEWQPAHDAPSGEIPVVWTNDYQEEPRRLVGEGYRIGKSKPSADGSPGFFVTILVQTDQS